MSKVQVQVPTTQLTSTTDSIISKVQVQVLVIQFQEKQEMRKLGMTIVTVVKLNYRNKTCSLQLDAGFIVLARWLQSCSYSFFIIIIHAFIMGAHSVMVLNQSRWQSPGGQHGKGVDGLFEKVSFQMAFEGVESG